MSAAQADVPIKMAIAAIPMAVVMGTAVQIREIITVIPPAVAVP
jgi:hypothetical protein